MTTEVKFREIIKHAWDNSPLYRQIYTDHGIRENDLVHIRLQDLPVVSKNDVMVRFDEAVTDSRLSLQNVAAWINDDKNSLNLYLDEYVLIGSSAGSEIASYIPYTLKEWRFMSTIVARDFIPNPLVFSQPIRHAFYFASDGHWASATNVSLASRNAHEVLRLSIMDPVEEVWARLNAFNPERLTGYASSIGWLAEWTLAGKLRINPKTVIVSGDQFTPSLRSLVQEAWKNPEIYDLYASAEALYMALRAPGCNHYRVFTDLVHMEVVNEAGQMVQPGERGRVLLTNLALSTLPLIRYDVWDYATLGSANFGVETLISIDGKTFDELPVRTVAGGIKNIPVYELTELHFPGLKKIQLISHQPEIIEIHYIAEENLDREVLDSFKKIVGEDFIALERVEVKRVDFLINGRGAKFFNVIHPDQRKIDTLFLGDQLMSEPSLPILKDRNPDLRFLPDNLDESILERFQVVLQTCGSRIAVQDRDCAYTYQQLDQISGKIARILLQKLLNSEQPVGILCNHRSEIIPLILGVLKAGGFYLPIDPYLPGARISQIISDTQPGILLTNQEQNGFAHKLKRPGLAIFCIDEILAEHTPDLQLPIPSPEDPACLLYTSGTSGTPKGVILSHKTIITRVRRYSYDFQISPGDSISLLQSSAVSASIRDIFGALLNGAVLNLFDLYSKDLVSLATWLKDNKITHFYTVPTIWRLFLDTLGETDFPNLRIVRLGGEPILSKDLAGFQQYFPPTCLFVNGYAATETGTICQYVMGYTTNLIANRMPVGKPVKGLEVQILDDKGESIENTLGELVVRGDSVATGYWDPTLKCIVPLNGSPYATGDQGFQLPDGRIFLTERRDRIVKVHGYRIHLNEIEGAVNAMEDVIEVAAVPRRTAEGDTTIELYYVTGSGKEYLPGEIRKVLTTLLPTAAIPTKYYALTALPRLPGGKINYNDLLNKSWINPPDHAVEVSYRNQIEARLAEIWGKYLKIRHIAPEADFFDLGGDSVTVIRVCNQIRSVFKVEISILEFFSRTTLNSMAELIKAKLSES